MTGISADINQVEDKHSNKITTTDDVHGQHMAQQSILECGSVIRVSSVYRDKQ